MNKNVGYEELKRYVWKPTDIEHEGGSFRGDAAYDANPFENFCRGLSGVWHAMALDKQWKEEDHPRDETGKFASYGVAPGLKNKAAKLGFAKWSQSDSGKIKLTHGNGSVLVVEPPGEKGGQSQVYSFYPADGSKPIKAQLTGQSGKSFFEKVGPLMSGMTAPTKKFADMSTEEFAAWEKSGAAPKTEQTSVTQSEKLILGDPEGVKKGLFDASDFEHEHLAQKYFSTLDGVQDELNNNKKFKEAADDYGLSAEDIVKLYKGEAEKHGAGETKGNTAAELKQQYEDGLIEHSEYIEKLKGIAAGPGGEKETNPTGKKEAPSKTDVVDHLVDEYDAKFVQNVLGGNPSQDYVQYKVGDDYIDIKKDGSWTITKPDGAKFHGSADDPYQDNSLDKLKEYLGGRKAETNPTGNTAAELKQQYEDGLIEHSEYIEKLKGIAAAPPIETMVDIENTAKQNGFEYKDSWNGGFGYQKGKTTLNIWKNGKWKISEAGKKPITGNTPDELKAHFSGKAPETEESAKKAADPAVLEQAKKASEAKNKMFKSLQDSGYANTPNQSLEKLGVIGFKKGDAQIKVAANGDWIAESPGFSAKAGSGEENLKAFLAGEKAFGTKWNKGELTSWLDEHDNSPDKVQKLAEKKAKEAEQQAAAKAKALEEQNIEALKKLKAEEDKKKTEAQLAAMKAEHAKQSAASQKLLHSWAATQPQPNAQAKSAVKSYTGSGYSSTNDSLRHGDIDLGHTGPNKALHSWINSCSFPEDMTLYRTVKGDFAKMIQASIPSGGVFMDKGFSSMTADPNFLWGYSKENKQSLRLQIKVKKGAKAAAVSTMSSSGQGEAEVIGNAGAMFKVVKQHGNYWEVELMDDNYWDSK